MGVGAKNQSKNCHILFEWLLRDKNISLSFLKHISLSVLFDPFLS
jgi:hypothetical protein